jgi:PKD repeat protein
MKKVLLFLVFALSFFGVSYSQSDNAEQNTENVEAKFENDFERTKDPALGYPTPIELRTIRNALKDGAYQKASSLQCGTWDERGPSNIGGRTRALMYDPNDVSGKKVWAGSVSGGLWYNNDITSATSGWIKVNDFWDNIAISSIAFNPLNTQEFYVCTGEGWSNADAHIGDGIRKSTDGGITWNLLTSTTGSNFYYIQKIVIHPVTGDIYIATKANGIMRSQDGGVTWVKVLGTSVGATQNTGADLEIGADNTIFASIGIGNTDGIYSSTTGNAGSWTKLNTGTNGFPTTGFQRIEFACAPSNANVLYALVQGAIYTTTNKGTTWTTCTYPGDAQWATADYTKGQAWYDLTVGVDPNNANTVFIGGIGIHKSTNAGTAWTQITQWTGYPWIPSWGSWANVHSDHHAIIFKSGSSTEMIFANDGGVYYSSTGTSAFPTIGDRNKNYNVTQFYSCAINPTAGSDNFLAGAQDNGTSRFNFAGINSTHTVYDGDGFFCAIDQINPNVQIASAFWGPYQRSTNTGSTFAALGAFSMAIFQNPTDYDDQGHTLYATTFPIDVIKYYDNLTATPTVGQFTISPTITFPSLIKDSPYTPNTIYVMGVIPAGAPILRVANANTAPVMTTIPSPPVTGTPSSMDFGIDEDHILLTYSNYGINSVWETSNGGINWKNLDDPLSANPLPNMPVWCGLYNPNNRKEVLIGTELGTWSCDDVSASSPEWFVANTGLPNVVVRQFKTRASDNLVIAATYGRGLYSSNIFLHPVPNFSFTTSSACIYAGSTVNFTDLSTLSPTTWLWNFGDATTSTLQNPTHTYSATGTYTVTLTVTNANGCGTITQQLIVSVAGAQTPDLYIIDSPADIGNEPDNETVTLQGINFWSSPDIWIRQVNDGLVNQTSQAIEYMASTPNYVYVRVKNRGCLSQSGDLKVYWASAGTGLSWNSDWVNNTATYAGCSASIYGDQIIPTKPVTVPALSDQIYMFPWQPNDPDDYNCFVDPFHFCLLARIETSTTSPFGMTAPEGTDVWTNTKDNNNIAWKNITVNDAVQGLIEPFGSTIIRNIEEKTRFINLSFLSRPDDIGQKLSDFKRIRLHFTHDFLKRWAEGGKRGKDVIQVNETDVEILSPNATMEHIFLRYKEIGSVAMSLKTKQEPQLSNDEYFNFDIIQYGEGMQTPQGGQTYQIRKGNSGENCFTASQTLSGTIIGTQFFTGDLQITGNIIVANGSVLKIENAKVLIDENVQIKVMPGGKLIINKSDLMSSCIGKKWGGIDVKGSLVFLNALTVTNSFITGTDSPIRIDKSKGILISNTGFLGYNIGMAIEMDKMKDFLISENTFSNFETGIKTNKTSAADVKSGIEKNIFYYVRRAIDFSEDDHTKLDIKCNRFCYTDYAIVSDQTTLKNQGTSIEGAGNDFISTSTLLNNKLKHTNGNAPKYYYDPSQPVTNGMNITTIASTADQTCYYYTFDTSSTSGARLIATGESVTKQENMLVYSVPNPNTGAATVYFNLGGDIQGELTTLNIHGEVVKRVSVNATAIKIEMDFSELAKGLYFMALTNSKGQRTSSKMIISR